MRVCASAGRRRSRRRRRGCTAALRDELAAAGHAYWKAHHAIEATASDYRRVIDLARARAAPVVADLPPHFVEDCTSAARERANRFGLTLDILRAGTAGGAGGGGKGGNARRGGGAGRG